MDNDRPTIPQSELPPDPAADSFARLDAKIDRLTEMVFRSLDELQRIRSLVEGDHEKRIRAVETIRPTALPHTDAE